MIGIVFAVCAMIFWGVGDFLIQRSARAMGRFRTVFFSSALGTIFLMPLTLLSLAKIKDISANFSLLLLTVVIAIFSAFFNITAFKKGKISIVAPILGFELPLTILLSYVLLSEHLLGRQLLLIGAIFTGLMLAVTSNLTIAHHKSLFEKGVFFAGIGALGLAMSNFMFGISSREISPLVVFLVVQLSLFCGAFFIILWRGHLPTLWKQLKNHKLLIAGVAICSNLGWLSYGYAVQHLPISLAIGISEAYIAIAVLLGLIVAREKITRHQAAGIVMAIGGVIILGLISA